MAINRSCVLRLSRYKYALNGLKKLGFVKIFSDNIADATGESSIRVRKDFSLFGITGNKKGGYQVDELITKLNSILGTSEVQKVVLAGVGKIGSALIEYAGLKSENIEIVRGFDISPQRIRVSGPVEVRSISEMGDFIKEQGIKIGIIAVPANAAQQALDIMVSSGIEGILNFAPVQLSGPPSVTITNVNLAAELENLIYFVKVDKRISPA